MNCKNIKTMLNDMQNILMTDYIDGELGPEQLKIAEEHLGSCSDCRQFKEDLLKNAVIPFYSIEKAVPPAYIWQNISNGIIEKTNNNYLSFFGFLHRYLTFPGISAATAVITVLIISSVLFIRQPSKNASDSAELTASESYFTYIYEGLEVSDAELSIPTEEYFYS